VFTLALAGMLIAGCANPKATPTPRATTPAPPASSPAASLASSPAASLASSPVASLASSPAASGIALSVEARELSFTPSELHASPESPVTFSLHDAGRLVHNLTIDELGIQLIASPGQTVSLDVAGLPAGTYAYYCSVSGHRQAGMEGTLTVK
jgi:plastocyanin